MSEKWNTSFDRLIKDTAIDANNMPRKSWTIPQATINENPQGKSLFLSLLESMSTKKQERQGIYEIPNQKQNEFTSYNFTKLRNAMKASRTAVTANPLPQATIAATHQESDPVTSKPAKRQAPTRGEIARPAKRSQAHLAATLKSKVREMEMGAIGMYPDDSNSFWHGQSADNGGSEIEALPHDDVLQMSRRCSQGSFRNTTAYRQRQQKDDDSSEA